MRTTFNNTFNKRISSFFIIMFIGITFFPSCVHHRDLLYLHEKDEDNEAVRSYFEAKLPDYKLKPKDELYIQINSLDDPTTNVFQPIGTQQNSSTSLGPYGASLQSYVIDSVGYIQLPVLGNIYVNKRSIPEVRSIIQDSLVNILNQPTVTIKLINRYVSVLGEVRSPGHFSYSQEKLSIYNALGLAGDITDYGDRNNVILARNEKGENLRINIDLTSSDVLSSEYYYLRPNDMVYVKPMRKKFWGMNGFPWSILMTSVSTSILIYTVFGDDQ